MKKLFDVKTSEKGFVLIEFVIALPLIILLLYGLAQTTFTIFSNAKEQAADYVLEVEAQDILTRITQDLRAASYVKHTAAKNIDNCENLEIKYHAIKQDAGKIIDIIDTRIYVIAKTNDHEPYIYAQRQNGYHSSPISGGNFFGDTSVIRLQYRKIDERLIHITLEMKSEVTRRRIKISTAVFMPACEEMVAF